MNHKLFHLFVLAALVFSSVAANNFSSDAQTTPPPGLPPGSVPPWAGTGVKNISATPPQERVIDPGMTAMTTEQMVSAILPRLSGGAAQIVAEKLGVNSIGGKPLSNITGMGIDNIVSVEGDRNENQPSLAVNPKNEAIVVAFHQYYPSATNKCIAMVSFNGGDTFEYNNYVFLPLQAPGNSCANPVVRFSPDGSYAYYFYTDIAASGATSDIVMVRAMGSDPRSLIGSPIVVLNDYGNFLDKPWGDVVYYDTSGTSDPVIYVTSTYFTSAGGCGILFNASYNYGATWQYTDVGLALASSANCSNRVLSGSRPIGNPYAGYVTACWYDSESDGWLNGKFDIACWTNDGFGSPLGTSYYFEAVNNMNYELPQWLGPNNSYHKWWTGMFPSLAVDDTGLLYVAFAADPTASKIDVESGDVFLARGWPTGSGWTRSVVDDGSSTNPNSQGFPTVTARCDYQLNKCFAYVAYEATKSSNKFYDIFYRRAARPFSLTSPGTFSWSGKTRITDVSSMSDYQFKGDYIDSFVTSRRYGVIWTDRADAKDKFDGDDDVMMDIMVP